jgi:hypothetical protein
MHTDIYKIALPFEEDWDPSTTCDALFLFAFMLAEALETAIGQHAEAQSQRRAERESSSDVCVERGSDRCSGAKPAAVGEGRDVYAMLRRRYLEDYATASCLSLGIHDTCGRAAAAKGSDSDKLPREKFKNRVTKYINSFMKLLATIVPSDAFPHHQYWALRTKTMDYIEEIFSHFAPLISRNYDEANRNSGHNDDTAGAVQLMELWIRCYVENRK